MNVQLKNMVLNLFATVRIIIALHLKNRARATEAYSAMGRHENNQFTQNTLKKEIAVVWRALRILLASTRAEYQIVPQDSCDKRVKRKRGARVLFPPSIQVF